MSQNLPARAKVVVIGGGIIGASALYHLTKAGCSDAVLLERDRFASGTTWHAAGIVGQLRDSKAQTELAQYTTALVPVARGRNRTSHRLQGKRLNDGGADAATP